MDKLIIIIIILLAFILFDCSCSCKKVENFSEDEKANIDKFSKIEKKLKEEQNYYIKQTNNLKNICKN
jgi:hypothetical protein